MTKKQWENLEHSVLSPVINYEFLRCLPPNLYPKILKMWFKEKTGEELNLENPENFNQKIQWLKLYDNSEFKTKLVDKYLVRDWIKEQIGEEYLIPLLGVWNKFDEIDFDKLPNSFALKANHGSAMNIIVKNKAEFNIAEAKVKFDRWLKTNFALSNGLELQYGDIKPKIIAEEYLDLNQGIELQFWCLNKNIEFISIIKEPHGVNIKMTVDKNWKELPFITSLPKFSDEEKEKLSKPKDFENMISNVEKLCKVFSFVRIDFYYLHNKTYFGEMTFTPASGMVNWQPNTTSNELGKLLTLPNIKKSLPEKSFAERGFGAL